MKFYSIKEVTEMLSISRALIYKWEKQGKITVKHINGVPRIEEKEIQRIISNS